MKPRKTKDPQRVLQAKGFTLYPEKSHHQFYYLVVDGQKTAVNTYFSHGLKEYGDPLMQLIKKQLRFRQTRQAEDFFDCPLTGEMYVALLREAGELR